MSDDQILRLEIVVFPDAGRPSMFADGVYPSVATVNDFAANPSRQIECARKLGVRDFTIDKIGRFSISASIEAEKFKEFFETELVEEERADDVRSLAPPPGAAFRVPEIDGLETIIERAYVQRPPHYFAGERILPPESVPPFGDDKFRLRVPDDVALLMQARTVHQRGIFGRGVTVAMPDNGFFKHPYFDAHGYNYLAIAAPDAIDYETDLSGHGTGISANLLAVAPGVNFIGIKQVNKTLGFKTAVEMGPDVISCSWAAELEENSPTLPNNLKPFHLTVLDAIARGIVVCVAAGNGGVKGFPGSIPEVISVGGVYVDRDLNYRASDHTSGFDSTWFPGRQTPDLCGLCGSKAEEDYITLPVPQAAHGGSAARDGWFAFSGSSSATPMVAGICALLKEVKPGLSPQEIKNLLKYTARDITSGMNANGRKARPGPDGAVGYGLADAARAVDAVT
ncbi:S8 family serine peptidase [Nisaea sp.]|uniref:S8 family serine peptidase n=1 Tax=Nisaea sp. TaxID=2024842 RepID=UPI002B26B3AD|nr:S8 family serine peptidase [Nisaea sp.]